MSDPGISNRSGQNRGISAPRRRSSRAWYLLPIFFLLLGGLASYVILLKRDPSRARNTLILGIILTTPYAILIVIGMFVEPTDDDYNDNELNSDNSDNSDNSVDIDEHPIIPKEVHSTISYNDIPSYANREDITNALKFAVFTWERSNPSLEFELGKDLDGNVHIRWVKHLEGNTAGWWRHVDMESIGQIDYIVVELGYYCGSVYNLYTRAQISTIIAHEIGHHLRLGHTGDPSHLMFSPNMPEMQYDDYDNRGYTVPTMSNIPPIC